MKNPLQIFTNDWMDRLLNTAFMSKLLVALGDNSNLTQYNLTVTGTNWTTVRAIGIPYQTSDGAWRMKLNISGTLSVSANSFAGTISGITFKVGVLQPLSSLQQSTVYNNAWAADGTAIFNIATGSVNGVMRVSGDVELDSKPTWL